MAEQDQEIFVDNVNGAVELVTSAKLFVQRPGASTTQLEEIGLAMIAATRESRDVIYNFVVGNSTATARDLIPGVIRNSTVTLNTMALYTKNIIAALGAQDATRWISSIRYQMRPFIIQEIVTHPITKKTRTIQYEGCVISDYDKALNMSGGDIRVLENVTVHYKTVSVTQDAIDSDSGA